MNYVPWILVAALVLPSALIFTLWRRGIKDRHICHTLVSSFLGTLALAFFAGFSGCAPIQQQGNISTPVAQRLVAGVGDVVLRAEGRESMPNVFGAADIFGRTRPTGFETVQFGGLQGNKVVLLRSSVTTQSDATTMNSSGMVLSTQQRGVVYIPPAGSTSTSMQNPTIPVVVDWRANPRVPALGRTIVIEDANAMALSYRIE